MEYGILKENFYDADFGSYESYGIKSHCGHIVSDISLNKKQVEKLISRINNKKTPLEYLPYEIDRIFDEKD